MSIFEPTTQWDVTIQQQLKTGDLAAVHHFNKWSDPGPNGMDWNAGTEFKIFANGEIEVFIPSITSNESKSKKLFIRAKYESKSGATVHTRDYVVVEGLTKGSPVSGKTVKLEDETFARLYEEAKKNNTDNLWRAWIRRGFDR